MPYNEPVAIAALKKEICLLTLGSRMLMFYDPIKDLYNNMQITEGIPVLHIIERRGKLLILAEEKVY